MGLKCNRLTNFLFIVIVCMTNNVAVFFSKSITSLRLVNCDWLMLIVRDARTEVQTSVAVGPANYVKQR